MLDLSAIKERVEKATPGPWELGAWSRVQGRTIRTEYVSEYGSDGRKRKHTICTVDRNRNTPNNDEFIVHARTDIPLLIAEVERLRESQSYNLNATIDCLQEKAKADAAMVEHYQGKITAANDMLDEMCEQCCADNDGCIVERMNTRDCFNKRIKEVLK